MPYYPDKEILATIQSRAAMGSTTKSDLGSADLMVYMGYKGTKDSYIGIAHIGSICQPKSFNKEHEKQCLNIWDEKISYAAQTIAHEVGHNLGMHHDHSTKYAYFPLIKYITCSPSMMQQPGTKKKNILTKKSGNLPAGFPKVSWLSIIDGPLGMLKKQIISRGNSFMFFYLAMVALARLTKEPH